VQVTNAALSNEHWKVEPSSLELKPNDADAEATTPLGPDEIVVSGGVVSTVHERAAGVASTLPAASIARTRNVCDPSAMPA
jgi:hypothetical protein